MRTNENTLSWWAPHESLETGRTKNSFALMAGNEVRQRKMQIFILEIKFERARATVANRPEHLDDGRVCQYWSSRFLTWKPFSSGLALDSRTSQVRELLGLHFDLPITNRRLAKKDSNLLNLKLWLNSWNQFFPNLSSKPWSSFYCKTSSESLQEKLIKLRTIWARHSL